MATLRSKTEGYPSHSSLSFLEELSGQSATSFIPKEPSLFRGQPAVSFSNEDIRRYSAPLRFSLIGKFSNGHPNLEVLRKSFLAIGFIGSHTIGLVDRRHILIRFELEQDYLRCYLRRIWFFEGLPMRVLKWHPQFFVDSEPSIVPIWISLPLLPVHLFNKEALFSIARLIGEPLQLDAPTSAVSRPSVARICVELDLQKDRSLEIYIINGDVGFWQPVIYEDLPAYCCSCLKVGHSPESCRSSPTGINSSLSVKVAEAPRQSIQRVYRPKKLDGDKPSASTTLVAVNPAYSVDTDASEPPQCNRQSTAILGQNSTNPTHPVCDEARKSETPLAVAPATDGTPSVSACTLLSSQCEPSGTISAAPEHVPPPAPNSTMLAAAATDGVSSVTAPYELSSQCHPSGIISATDEHFSAPALPSAASTLPPTAVSVTPLPSAVISPPSRPSLSINATAELLASASVNPNPAASPFPSTSASNATSPNAVLISPSPSGCSNVVVLDSQVAVTSALSSLSVVKSAALSQQFSSVELEDIFKNFTDIPFALYRSSKNEDPVSSSVANPASPNALIAAAPVVEFTPLAVLPPVADEEDYHAESPSEDFPEYDNHFEVQLPFFQPLVPLRGRGKKKLTSHSDRVLRTRKGK